ncbi:hypothetical protein GH714_035825 [Hevea brasiliensis]|uniref:RecA-like N-terminal domain-containing protein n=1 Tax=Hevea brasiliensis TaxID=3981 RepID=A0A6A6M5P1_HEVBR|nr:hypothetical protein GH714_035825 [Hevea brasiliensis]
MAPMPSSNSISEIYFLIKSKPYHKEMVPFLHSFLINSFSRFRLCSLCPPLPQNRRIDAATCIGSKARLLCSVANFSDFFECDQRHDHGEAKEKDAALRLALTQLAGEFGRESMLSLQRFFSSRHAPVIPTGSLKLDLALGIGGLPKGRMIEIYGEKLLGRQRLHFILSRKLKNWVGISGE